MYPQQQFTTLPTAVSSPAYIGSGNYTPMNYYPSSASGSVLSSQTYSSNANDAKPNSSSPKSASSPSTIRNQGFGTSIPSPRNNSSVNTSKSPSSTHITNTILRKSTSISPRGFQSNAKGFTVAGKQSAPSPVAVHTSDSNRSTSFSSASIKTTSPSSRNLETKQHATTSFSPTSSASDLATNNIPHRIAYQPSTQTSASGFGLSPTSTNSTLQSGFAQNAMNNMSPRSQLGFASAPGGTEPLSLSGSGRQSSLTSAVMNMPNNKQSNGAPISPRSSFGFATTDNNAYAPPPSLAGFGLSPTSANSTLQSGFAQNAMNNMSPRSQLGFASAPGGTEPLSLSGSGRQSSLTSAVMKMPSK